MRCEICNRAETVEYVDMAGDPHNYCWFCIDEIEDTLDSYDEDDDVSLWDTHWDIEETSEEDQEDKPDDSGD